jgi:ribosomal protein S18 acetylase RimI-like enzyme
MTAFATEIVRASAGDAQDLSVLSAELFPLGCPADTAAADLAAYIDRELTPERFRSLLEDDCNAILVARISSKLAGYAMIARAAAPQPSLANCELRKFYIAPAYHGTGIAHALMEQVLGLAADTPDTGLWLSVFSGNTRAIAFYRRWGFRVTGIHDFLVGSDPQRDFLMERESPAGP